MLIFLSSDPVAVRARASPIALNAYICNYREHWFTIRYLSKVCAVYVHTFIEV